MLKELLFLLHPLDILLLLLLSLSALLSNLGLLGASAWLVSSAALQPPLFALTLGITAVRALGIARALLRYGERYFTHKSAFSILDSLRLHLYDKARILAGTPHTTKNKNTFLSDLLSNADILQEFLLRGILPPIVVLCATLLVALFLRPVLSYVVLILPLLYLVHCLPLWIKPHLYTDSRYRNQLLDFAQGIPELLLAGSLNTAVAKLNKTAKHWQIHQQHDKTLTDRLDFLLGILRIFAFFLLFILLLYTLQQGQIDGISLSVWLLVLLAFFNELAVLPTAARQFRQAQIASDCLQAPAESACTNEVSPSDKLLTVSGLGFHYPQGMPVFSSLNFSITAGCHTAIIGDSGCGKTTLACLLAGLWPPTEGSIYYGSSLRPFICTIPQGSFLFSASIRENFSRLQPAASEKEIVLALQTAQLAPVIEKLPQGMDTPLGENACSLSGGERNRLISALILVSSAPVLLFDEPTAGLDRQTADKLLTAILDRAELTGQTIILITHDMPQLFRFSQVIKLTPSQT